MSYYTGHFSLTSNISTPMIMANPTGKHSKKNSMTYRISNTPTFYHILPLKWKRQATLPALPVCLSKCNRFQFLTAFKWTTYI